MKTHEAQGYRTMERQSEVARVGQATPPETRASRLTAGRSPWQRGYLFTLLAADAAGVVAGGTIASAVDPAKTAAHLIGTSLSLSYASVTLLIVAFWIVTLTLNRVFNARVLAAGTDEYRRVFHAVFQMLGGVAAVAFFLHLNLSRSYVAIVGPVTLVWTLAAHWSARQWLHARRRAGHCQQPTVVVGSPSHLSDLVSHFRQFPHYGFDVVGACTGGDEEELNVRDSPLAVVATPQTLVGWIRQGHVTAVVVADASVLGPGALRQFAWQLEGSGVDLIVAPNVTGVAGPRIAVRPVEGLPLLHLEEPRFDGVSRFLKGCIERTSALIFLVALSPLLVLTAVAIKLASPGPVFYRQTRVGRDGKTFSMVKFRTMVDGTDKLREQLASQNDHIDGPLFKMRRDPRVTTIGRWLRRFSIDELPQLAHVVSGKMAVVGPRPPLPSEVANYTDDAWRRLLVRPGLTGLWQVSGRSTLPWMEALRLDLYYVDNWSLALDLVITIKTFSAVLRGRGAF